MENTTTNTNGRRTNLQILDDKRNELAQGLVTYKQYLDVIPVNKQDVFKKNFLELATQDYLLSIVDTKELLRFAANVTKLGLDIAPSSKEVYIIPFDTTINKQKVMLPQAIIPMNGMQQLAYAKGFFLEIDAVWKFDDGSCESASKLSRLQQSQLRSADPKWVDSHFIGFDVVLTDMKHELPTQTRFVELNYVQEATKTIKDARWKLQTWRHKAVRRAYGDFMIPRDRKIEAFEEIEALNDSVLEKADVSTTVQVIFSSEIDAAVKALGLGIERHGTTVIVSGKTFGKEKLLKELGFEFQSGEWAMPCDEISIPAQIKAPTKTPSPVNELMQYLKDNDLSKEEIGMFVKEWLKLNSSDIEGIENELSDKNHLDEKIQAFKARAEGEQAPNGLF